MPCTEKPKLPDSFEEDTWLKLKLCINAVHTETPVGQSFEELYKVLLLKIKYCDVVLTITALLRRPLRICVFTSSDRDYIADLKKSARDILRKAYEI
jgi:hypothetical protein